MSVAGATPDQLAQLSAFTVLLRSVCRDMMQLNKGINALVLAWDANILQIIGAPQGTPVVDNANYAGAVQLTDTQITNLFGILQTMQTNTLTAGNQQAMTLAVGPANVV